MCFALFFFFCILLYLAWLIRLNSIALHCFTLCDCALLCMSVFCAALLCMSLLFIGSLSSVWFILHCLLHFSPCAVLGLLTWFILHCWLTPKQSKHRTVNQSITASCNTVQHETQTLCWARHNHTMQCKANKLKSKWSIATQTDTQPTNAKQKQSKQHTPW